VCEFKVYLKNELIAEDIVKVSLQNGSLKLTDILNSSKDVEGAIVSNIDVGRERLEIKHSPLIRQFLQFMSLYEECQSKGLYKKGIESVWGKIKEEGEKLLSDLKKQVK
jgi:predicted RNA-binding protein